MCRPSVGASISSASEGRKPASVLPAPVGATSRALRPARAAASISSWCRRGAQPLAANQSAIAGGRFVIPSLSGSLTRDGALNHGVHGSDSSGCASRRRSSPCAVSPLPRDRGRGSPARSCASRATAAAAPRADAASSSGPTMLRSPNCLVHGSILAAALGRGVSPPYSSRWPVSVPGSSLFPKAST